MRVLGWRPSDFWAASLTELFDAFDAAAEAQGVSGEAAAPSRDEMAELMARYG